MVLTAAAPVELKGTLRMDPVGPIAPASMIPLRPAGVMTAMPIRITPEADGSFTAPNLAPSRYSGFAIEAIGNVLIHVSAVGDFACEIDFVELRQLLAFGVLIQKVSSTFQMWDIWKRSSAVKFLSSIGAAYEDQARQRSPQQFDRR